MQFHLEASPGLVDEWLGTYADERRDRGVVDAHVQADTCRYWRRYRDVAAPLVKEPDPREAGRAHTHLSAT